MANSTSKPELHVDTVAEWEAWLDADPDPNGVRLRLRKKATNKPGITYAEALDVALCFGWIDGQSQSLDADYYLHTFTPRRTRSMWSKVNIGHVTRLIEEGRMRPQGQREIDRAKADGRWDNAYRQRDAELPAELQEALDADPSIAQAFASQSAQNRFAMAFRVANLKRPASRAARVADYVEMLRRGETIH
ncbi:bacteriocin-protection protein, YdeI/OmpD-associated family [Microbacterium sp. CFH 90308]|uniref:Bacteriocin-protection protein, YdeI/OmpD-associated family n=1 Tax=Microbacterium salsuginis TaxID=2722803 RepID=A0ABX1K602_9MICO|nr:YdeI/OmpD-associated family protein [Microbacterium sp. CFH 90308]NLP82427.1 bacteriocin-protection protein, YdeI/OmpD-associated family [Microbacterium sp. CFH 90308]